MGWAITVESRVNVALRCDRCGFEDKYVSVPALDPTKEPILDGWHCPDESYLHQTVCPVCVEADPALSPGYSPALPRHP